ncbi:hypothetical protein [Parasphingorhabdus pacifica]
MESEEARRALREVSGRQQQTAAAMAGLHPPVWSTAVFVFGYYVVFAGIDFAFPVPLICFGVGGLIMAGGLLVGIRHERKAGVKGPRDLWDTRTIILVCAWLLALSVVFHLGRVALAGVVPVGPSSVLAAVPAAVICAFMVRWIYRRAYGGAVER